MHEEFFREEQWFMYVSVLFFFREDDGMMAKKTSSAFLPNDSAVALQRERKIIGRCFLPFLAFE